LRGQDLPLRFNFPDKSQAKVTENLVRDGKQIKFTYDIVIRREAGAGIRVEHSNARVLEWQGNPITQAENDASMLMTLTLSGKTAILEITDEGIFQRITNAKEIVSAFETVMGLVTQNKTQENLREQMIDAVRGEKGQAMINLAAARPWKACVETWVGFDVKPGKTESRQIEIEELPGVPIEWEQTLANLGNVTGNPKLWHLTLQSRVSDKAYGQKMVDHMRSVNPEAAAQVTAEMASRMQPATAMECHIDPLTLRPTWVKVQTKVGEGPKAKIQDSEYEFKWVLKE
jgi:hypothetical protein